VVYLWEDDLLREDQGVVPSTIEGAPSGSPEISNPGQGGIEEPVQEVIHPVCPEGYHHPDGLAAAQLESRYGTSGLGGHWALAGYSLQVSLGGFEGLGVLQRLP